MKFSFLGTGTSSGVPMIACDCYVCTSKDPRDKRLRTAGLLEKGNTRVVFDTGPDFRQQILRSGIKELQAVVFTHSHKDHIAGMDDIRAFNFFMKQDMNIYGTSITLDRVKIEFSYIFEAADYPGVPRVQIHEIDENPFRIGDIDLTPIPVLHKEMEVYGFRSGNFAYVTDANYISPESMEKLRGLDVLVLNALRWQKHYSHFTLDEAIEIIEELRPQKAYLTHISHQLATHEKLLEYLPKGIEPAYDGLEIEVF
ncbi:MAG: MBL fold metallo-hydrolase [Bacteroidia bacterium]|nr:MBL fold metallo-hydrolase [Bacteroidia bacterium]